MRNGVICLCLATLTVAVYWKVRGCEFVNYDDEKYVYENAHVLKGLTWETIRWAFSSFDAANYHPLTWISLECDVSLFGLQPSYYHLENVGIHAVNVVLLFLFLARASGDWKPSAFSAASFAVHPVHVESVAWVAERKDVLAGLFFMLALLIYLAYVRATVRKRRYCLYAATLVTLSLGLLTKQTLVTFPFVLLLLDFWPLRRTSFASAGGYRRGWYSLVVEKIPMLILCLAASTATYLAQRAGGAIEDGIALPIKKRLCNAALAYSRYLGKFFWPSHLAVFYPRINAMPDRVALSIALFAAITALSVASRKHRPFLLVGWFFFAGMLVPMIGIVQVGAQSIADRYMYLPMIGLILIVAWGAKDVMSLLESSKLANSKWSRSLCGAAAAGVLLGAAGLTIKQLNYWRDTKTLFEHALAVTDENAFANLQLAYLDARRGDVAAARGHYEEAVRIEPGYFLAQFDLANLLLNNHQPAKAIEHYQRASQDSPGATRTGETERWLAELQNNWGIALLQLRQLHDAFEHFRMAVKIDPGLADAHFNLGQLLFQAGRLDIAENEFRQTLQIDPNHAGALSRLHAIDVARSPTTRRM